MESQEKGIIIHRVVDVKIKNGVRTERELTKKEIEEWIKSCEKTIKTEK